MRTSSRALALSLGVLAMVGCSAILDLEERPIDDGLPTSPIREGGVDSAPKPLLEASVVDQVSPEVDSSDGKIPCIGTRMNAFFCDDFEVPVLDSRWRVDFQGATAKAGTYAPGGGFSTRSGTRVLESGFDNLPTTTGNRAIISFQHPKQEGGPIAVRFAIFRPDDPWPAAERFPLAAIRTGGAQSATLVFVPTTDGNGRIELDVTGKASVVVGNSTKETWACYELAFDGTNVSAYDGTTPKQGPALEAVATSVEVGLGYPLAGNGSSSKFIYFEDVIVAPAPVGCF